MKWLRRWFGRHAALEQDDPAFGRIVFSPGPGAELWTHAPAGPDDHLVVIIAPAAGPAPAQRDFHAALRTRLAAEVARSRDFVAVHAGAPVEPGALRLYAVEIGPSDELAAGRFVIELSDAEATCIHRVEYESGRPTVYGCDD